jgi:hypothetical protein
MPTLPQVWQQINGLPHKYIFYTRKEIRYLPKILAENERILALVSGFMNKHTWLCVCTTRRVLFLDRGMFFGLRQVQMNLDRLQAIDSSSGLLFGSIRMWDSASSMVITMVMRSSIAPFVRTVQEAMDHYKRMMVHDMANAVAGSQQATQTTGDKGAFVSDLERLSKLRADGHLTDEEYASAKAKLLTK